MLLNTLRNDNCLLQQAIGRTNLLPQNSTSLCRSVFIASMQGSDSMHQLLDFLPIVCILDSTFGRSTYTYVEKEVQPSQSNLLDQGSYSR